MKKINVLFVVLAVFSILIISCTPAVETKAMDKEKDAAMEKDVSTEDKALQKDEDTMKKDDSAMEKDGTAMENKDSTITENYKGKVLAGTTSKYLEFNKEDYDNALKANKKILLYFYASWCPICRAEQPNTLAAFNELDAPDLVGFRVNYKDSDTDADEEALAKEFGVAYQHTKVILKDGQRVGKFPDTWNKQRYLDELAKV